MKAYAEFNNLSSKLDELCDKQLMTYEFDRSGYPIVLTIRPQKSEGAQMEMYSQDRETCSADATLKYRFYTDGIEVKITGRLLLPDDIMNKFKSLAKKMVAAYLFGYFAECREREAMIAHNKRGFEDDGESAEAEEAPEADDALFDGFFGGEDEENEDGAEE
jgi:hypothetical protein